MSVWPVDDPTFADASSVPELFEPFPWGDQDTDPDGPLVCPCCGCIECPEWCEMFHLVDDWAATAADVAHDEANNSDRDDIF